MLVMNICYLGLLVDITSYASFKKEKQKPNRS
jgi:hypothetical protein